MSVHSIGAPLASLTNFRQYHFSFQGVFMQEQEGKIKEAMQKHTVNEPSGGTMYCHSKHLCYTSYYPLYVRDVRANKVKCAPNPWF